MAAPVDYLGRAERTAEWLDLADGNVRSAKRLARDKKLRRHAIFHLQQAMEMAVKGLAAGSGYSHDRLKDEFRHDYVELYVSLLQDKLGQSGLVDRISVKGGEKTCHWGGVKLYHLGGA